MAMVRHVRTMTSRRTVAQSPRAIPAGAAPAGDLLDVEVARPR